MSFIQRLALGHYVRVNFFSVPGIKCHTYIVVVCAYTPATDLL